MYGDIHHFCLLLHPKRSSVFAPETHCTSVQRYQTQFVPRVILMLDQNIHKLTTGSIKAQMKL